MELQAEEMEECGVSEEASEWIRSCLSAWGRNRSCLVESFGKKDDDDDDDKIFDCLKIILKGNVLFKKIVIVTVRRGTIVLLPHRHSSSKAKRHMSEYKHPDS